MSVWLMKKFALCAEEKFSLTIISLIEMKSAIDAGKNGSRKRENRSMNIGDRGYETADYLLGLGV